MLLRVAMVDQTVPKNFAAHTNRQMIMPATGSWLTKREHDTRNWWPKREAVHQRSHQDYLAREVRSERWERKNEEASVGKKRTRRQALGKKERGGKRWERKNEEVSVGNERTRRRATAILMTSSK